MSVCVAPAICSEVYPNIVKRFIRIRQDFRRDDVRSIFSSKPVDTKYRSDYTMLAGTKFCSYLYLTTRNPVYQQKHERLFVLPFVNDMRPGNEKVRVCARGAALCGAEWEICSRVRTWGYESLNNRLFRLFLFLLVSRLIVTLRRLSPSSLPAFASFFPSML